MLISSVASLSALGFSTLPALVYMKPHVKVPLFWTLGVFPFFPLSGLLLIQSISTISLGTTVNFS